jgi:hypothetical protein
MNFKPNYFVIPGLLLLLGFFNAHLNGIFQEMGWAQFDAFSMAILIGIMALVSLFKAIPIILFWNNFPRREAHFYPILGLFMLVELLVLFSSFLVTSQVSPTTLMVLSFAPAIIDFIIVVALWQHGLRVAAYWLFSLLLFGLAIKFSAKTGGVDFFPHPYEKTFQSRAKVSREGNYRVSKSCVVMEEE